MRTLKIVILIFIIRNLNYWEKYQICIINNVNKKFKLILKMCII